MQTKLVGLEGKCAGGTEQVTGTEWHKLPGIKLVESGDTERSVGITVDSPPTSNADTVTTRITGSRNAESVCCVHLGVEGLLLVSLPADTQD